jgi:hypothetical protein
MYPFPPNTFAVENFFQVYIPKTFITNGPWKTAAGLQETAGSEIVTHLLLTGLKIHTQTCPLKTGGLITLSAITDTMT